MMVPRLTDHAVIRYMDRLRHIEIAEGDKESLAEGRRHMAAILPHGRWERRAPKWSGRLRGGCDSYFVLGDDICFIVQRGCAVTCIVKGTLPTPTRVRRNAHRAAKRYGKRKRGGR